MSVHLILDARKLGDFGIGIYIENLVHGLLDLQDSGRIELDLSLLIPPHFLEGGATLSVQQLLSSIDRRVEFIKENSGKYSLSEYLLLPFRQRRHLQLADIYHSPHFTLPYFLGIPKVVTIHDVIHINRPENMLHRLLAPQLIKSALKRADHVISVSAASAEKIREAVPSSGTPITIVANALQPGIEVMPRSEVSAFLEQQEFGQRDYCLFVGNDRPHKGFTELMAAWARLLQRWGDMRPLPDLVVVGDRFGAAAHDTVRQFGLERRTHFTGCVLRHELCALYNGAKAVIAPSREEGFGLVALEALACGVPVICTPHASYREVCGDAAWYSQDFGAEAIARAVDYALSNELQSKKKILAGLERIQSFSRTAAAEGTCEVYEQVLAARVQKAPSRSDYTKRSSESGAGKKILIQQQEGSARTILSRFRESAG